MIDLLKKNEKPYIVALLIVLLTYGSFELFKLGYGFGKEKANQSIITSSSK